MSGFEISEMIWFLLVIASNILIGAAVWAAIDDDDERYFKWYKSCPIQIAWIAQPAILMLWPVGVWVRFTEWSLTKPEEKNDEV